MKKFVFLFVIIVLVITVNMNCEREKAEPLSNTMAREIAMLPGEAPGMGYLNIREMKESPFFSIFEDKMDQDAFYSEEYREFMDATGLDIRKDIHEIYFCFFPGESPQFLAVVLGDFRPEAIMDYVRKEMKDEEMTEESYGAYTLYGTGQQEVTVSFAGTRRLIAGNADMVKQWIDNFTSEKQEKMTTETLERLRTIKFKSHAWMSLQTADMMDRIIDDMQRHTEGSRFQGLRSLQQVNFSMKLNQKLNFAGVTVFASAENASLFKEALEGWIATAKLAVSNERKAVDVLNKIDVSNWGQEVLIRFEMTPEDIRTLRSKDLKIALN